MFDQKEIEAYRKISAPSDLRDKILSSCTDTAPRKKTARDYMRWASSVAACFVLVAVLTVLGAGNFGNVSVSVSDEELTKERSVVYDLNDGRAAPAAHGLAETTVEMTIEGHAALSVSDGSMNIVKADTGDVLNTGTDLSIHGETLVHWTVSADENAHIFEMTVRGTFKTEKIILTYDVSEKNWMLTRTDAE